METMWFSSVIRGHRIYKEVWEPIHGQILQCTRETSNRFDPFAVSIVSDGEIVGHERFQLHVCCSCSIKGQFSVKLQEIGGIQVIFHKGDLKSHVN